MPSTSLSHIIIKQQRLAYNCKDSFLSGESTSCLNLHQCLLLNQNFVVLWSVSLAIAFTSFEWAFLWMSLVITIVLTITTVVLALKLPPLSEKGFILFIVMSIVFATLAFITKFVNYFIPETSNLLKSIICNFGTVFAVSFIVLMIFLLIGLRHWIIWFFAPQPSEFILAFLVWFLIIILFTETYTSLELCIPKNDTKRGTSGHKDTHFLALQTI
uniref:Uncharacterized protein n=1 Tax=Trichobilharzia regenti TaxID=157069 RepID=A0AA85J333_TRIRE|nr:unnamed protein product [Trichobilharzia regenti]